MDLKLRNHYPLLNQEELSIKSTKELTSLMIFKTKWVFVRSTLGDLWISFIILLNSSRDLNLANMRAS